MKRVGKQEKIVVKGLGRITEQDYRGFIGAIFTLGYFSLLAYALTVSGVEGMLTVGGSSAHSMAS